MQAFVTSAGALQPWWTLRLPLPRGSEATCRGSRAQLCGWLAAQCGRLFTLLSVVELLVGLAQSNLAPYWAACRQLSQKKDPISPVFSIAKELLPVFAKSHCQRSWQLQLQILYPLLTWGSFPPSSKHCGNPGFFSWVVSCGPCQCLTIMKGNLTLTDLPYSHVPVGLLSALVQKQDVQRDIHHERKCRGWRISAFCITPSLAQISWFLFEGCFHCHSSLFWSLYYRIQNCTY